MNFETFEDEDLLTLFRELHPNIPEDHLTIMGGTVYYLKDEQIAWGLTATEMLVRIVAAQLRHEQPSTRGN